MRWSRTFIPTLKELPADAEVPSHRLMLKAGLIRPLGAGAYSYLPLGWRALKKAIDIVREEMDRAGALEVLLPALQPLSLWQETGRDTVLGEVLIRFRDRRGRPTVLGPTHEEVITDIVRNELRSYRQLPLILYQIQTKFRDEERPRAGVLRTREFIMKDGYSFDVDEEGLERSYRAMYDAYVRIFKRCGLEVLSVEAESGAMGGSASCEFMVATPSGEDSLAMCSACEYRANVERCELPPVAEAPPGAATLQKVSTPGIATAEKVAAFLGIKTNNLVKTLIYLVGDEPVAVLIRGDHEANEAKLARRWSPKVVKLADDATVQKVTGAPVGFAGPIGLKGVKEIVADYSVAEMVDFVTGANAPDAHLVGVNRVRDFQPTAYADLRMACEGDPCPRCRNRLKIERGIEVGHVFKLGTKYSQAMKATFLDESGTERPAIMGCYGIGVNRILAAAIEQHHDENGIIWPAAIAPYEADVLCLNPTSDAIREASERAYRTLLDAGVDAILDDRDVRAGVKFKDADLVGFPVRVAVGDKALAAGGLEVKRRDSDRAEIVPPEQLAAKVKELLQKG